MTRTRQQVPLYAVDLRRFWVELRGLEPLTPSMPSMRRAWSLGPAAGHGRCQRPPGCPNVGERCYRGCYSWSQWRGWAAAPSPERPEGPHARHRRGRRAAPAAERSGAALIDVGEVFTKSAVASQSHPQSPVQKSRMARPDPATTFQYRVLAVARLAERVPAATPHVPGGRGTHRVTSWRNATK
jgi:hypothetical protein